ncbi:MAG TPA: pyridoxamine 5'-phosphate oxidase family protein [Actinomycetes bacterium]|nr:pyridoxamine 5'-phosphate oxidase family protein [Actinomycetes bacterium]
MSAEAPRSADGSLYPPTQRTRPSRLRDRARYDEQTVHAILDEGLICHLSFVIDGEPAVLPTLYARVAGHLYLHGSTGSRPLLAALSEDGLPVSVAVTIIDGLVLARSAFHHSVNYRSVIAHGRANLVREPVEREAALAAIVDRVAPGRWADCRPPSPQELAATAVLRLELAEVSAKVRTGGVIDEPADLALPYWAGVIPISTLREKPVPDRDLAAGLPLPPYLAAQ